MNAISKKTVATLEKSTMYVTLFPCNECAKLIIQSGIDRVVYLCDKYSDHEEFQESKIMFQLAGVKHEKINSNKHIKFNLKNENGDIQISDISK